MPFAQIVDIKKKKYPRIADIPFDLADNTYDRFFGAKTLADNTLPQTVNFRGYPLWVGSTLVLVGPPWFVVARSVSVWSPISRISVVTSRISLTP